MDNKQQLQNDINVAIKLIKRKIPIYNFSEYDSLYAFTNENLNAYFKKANMNNKEILTVAGSGDHIFDSLLRNPKSITAFDINALTPYYINLKDAAIRSLSIDEFIDFFYIDNNYYNVFHEKTYNKIRKNLDEQSLIFWDTLYSSFFGKKIRTSNLFHSTEGSYIFLKNAVSYFQPEYYEKLKKILLERQESKNTISVNTYNITDPNLIKNKKFDIILLSNIAHYIEDIYDKNYLENFKNLITQKLASSLNDEGIICAAYLFWGYVHNERKFSLIERQSLRSQYFKDNFEEWEIENNFLQCPTKNYVLVYKK